MRIYYPRDEGTWRRKCKVWRRGCNFCLSAERTQPAIKPRGLSALYRSNVVLVSLGQWGFTFVGKKKNFGATTKTLSFEVIVVYGYLNGSSHSRPIINHCKILRQFSSIDDSRANKFRHVNVYPAIFERAWPILLLNRGPIGIIIVHQGRCLSILSLRCAEGVVKNFSLTRRRGRGG